MLILSMMKKLVVIIVFIGCWFNLAPAQENNSTGILRIQIDVNNATLTIDGEIISIDSYGNRLIGQSSFILSLSPGDYNLIFSAENYRPIDTTITMVLNEVLPLNIQFIVDDLAVDSVMNPVNVNITSQPENIKILLKNKSDTITTPDSVSLLPGTLSFNAFCEGYQSLVTNYELAANDNVSLEFLLKTNKPAKITILDLGLEYKPILLERSEREANVIRSKYTALAEMFVIFPLTQGILAKLILDNDNDKDADILIISGAVLSVGSFLLGKILHKKRKKYIQRYNEQLIFDNQLARKFNSDIDMTIKTQNTENLKQWELENNDKGIIRTLSE